MLPRKGDDDSFSRFVHGLLPDINIQNFSECNNHLGMLIGGQILCISRGGQMLHRKPEHGPCGSK